MTVWNIAVTSPQASPAINATSNAANGCTPLVIKIAHTAPPVTIEPSTVKSAKSRILYVINKPIAIIPHIKPCAMAFGNALSISIQPPIMQLPCSHQE